MMGSFRQSMGWLHTWSGLVVGWVLLAIFVTGTASYYRADISRWMRPELAWAEPLTAAELGAAAERATAYLTVHAPKARSWFIGMPGPDKPVLDLFWRTGPGEPPGHVLLDPATGREARVRETEGGDFLYRFHFELHMAPLWGRWIVGICAIVMLVALISGIITHRRFFADLFTFRRDKAIRRSLLDAHNVGGVLALPFHLMITYTGVVTLATFYMPWGVTAAYRGNAPAFFADAAWITTPRRPANRPAVGTPIGPVVERAVALVAEPLQRLTVVSPGDANATVVAVFEEPRGIARRQPQLAFDGVTGAVLEARGLDLKPAAQTFTVLTGLHEAQFARPALRLLFFLCGVMGSVTIATGIILWSLARLPRAGERPFPGLRLVQALNVGTVAGLPAAVAAYFIANRLLPVDLDGRAEWEIRAFFGTWIAVLLLSLVRPHRRAWGEGFAAVALLCCAVATADILTLPQHPLRRLGGDPLYLWFDAAMLALAVLFAVAARKVVRYKAPAPRRRKSDGVQTAFPGASRPHGL